MTVLQRGRIWGAAVLLASTLAAAPACATSAHGRIYVRTGPPAPIAAQRVAPRRGYVWVPGYYRWDGRRYVWIAGEYVRPPRARAVWVPGRWSRDRRGWFWIEGRWR